jgi:hypothetical protein
MQKFLLNTMLAATLGLTSLSFAPIASAQDLEVEIGRNGPKVRVTDCDPAFENCYRERRREAARSCTEGRALNKADRMGIRRARITSVGRRTIEVRGRDRSGDRVYITFGRAPNCPVIG